MEKKIITFTADEQSLRKTGGIPNYASNKVSYIEAQFELGENWQGFDAVRAIWYNKAQTISMVLADGKCIVPYEVLANKGQVMVNLVGSISENDVLTDRLTTYPVVALIVDADAKVDGSNTYPITPSQFEQFVEAVKADAESASESAESASASAESASASAESAHDDKIEIEQKIAEVIQQIEDFEQVEVVVNTLPAGSQATSDFTDGVLTLGIPQGAKGDTGNGIASCVLNADYTLKINFTDGTSYTTTSIRGEQGAKGDTGNGISSITKTGSETVDGRVVDTYTTTFTDGETTEFEVTNGKDGEVTMSQLSALLPTDTASGSIASFPDGTDLFPALSVKAQIEPIQDLHGYDKPWSGGAGRNLLNVGGRVNQTWASVQYTSEDDFVIMNGTKNGGGYANLTQLTITLPAGTYYAKAFAVSGTTTNDISVYPFDGNADVVGNILGAEKSFTLSEEKTFYFRFAVWNDGTVLTNYKVGIVISKTSGIDKFYPYSNICPISGHTECVTSVSGVNVWDEEWEVGGINPTTGDDTSDRDRIRTKNMVPVFPSTKYYVSFPTGIGGIYICYYSSESIDGFISAFFCNTAKEVTTPTSCKYIRFATQGAYGATYNHDISINYPSTDHDYHAYNGNTYTTTLGRTVYGGEVEQVGGELTDSMGVLDMTSITDWNIDRNAKRIYKVLSYIKPNTSGATIPNVLSNRFEAVTPNDIYANKQGVTVSTGSALQFHIDGLTDKADVTLAEVNQYFIDNPTQIVYELATPQTYQLTPTEVDLLLGQNNLWTDCGSVEVTYKADIQRWVNKKINALI